MSAPEGGGRPPPEDIPDLPDLTPEQAERMEKRFHAALDERYRRKVRERRARMALGGLLAVAVASALAAGTAALSAASHRDGGRVELARRRSTAITCESAPASVATSTDQDAGAPRPRR